MKKKNEKHFVYHIKSIRKVGATEDLQRRVEDEQGFSVNEYDVVCTTNSVDYASDIEEALQEFYNYRKDTNTYSQMKRKKNYTKAAKTASYDANKVLTLKQVNPTGNVGVNMGLKNIERLLDLSPRGIKFVKFNGEVIKFDSEEMLEVIKLAEPSQFPTSDFFFRLKKITNLREEMDIEYGNQEMTAAHELWNMAQEDAYGDFYKDEFGVTRHKDTNEVSRSHIQPQGTFKKPYIHDKFKEAICGTPAIWAAEDKAKRQQNQCSDLEVGNHTSIDLDKLMLMQKLLQSEFPSTSDIGDKDTKLVDVAAMAQRNWHAFTDEYCEFMDAIGGINDGIKNAAWKYWKADHQLAQTLTLGDLSERDLKELQMEVVDMLHFFMNFALMVGMSGSDLFNMYVAKNKENFDRQERGY